MKNYTLECTTSEFVDCVPLDLLPNGELDLCDALYFAADVDHRNGTEHDGDHYGKVLETIAPLFRRETDVLHAIIDGISYSFKVVLA